MIKTTHIKQAGYENIYVDCPFCRKQNVFNRVSDKIGDDIDNKENIACYYCSKLFNISGDEIVTAKYKWFFNDLNKLKTNKEYRMYILNLCQGCESFFRQAIINKLIDRNIQFRDGEGNIILDKSNSALQKLNSKLKKAAISELRNKFLSIYDSEKVNDNGNLSKMKMDEREASFEYIKKTKINKLRNKVVHGNAYRPTLTEVEEFNPLIKYVFWLDRYLGVEDSLYILNKPIQT